MPQARQVNMNYFFTKLSTLKFFLYILFIKKLQRLQFPDSDSGIKMVTTCYLEDYRQVEVVKYKKRKEHIPILLAPDPFYPCKIICNKNANMGTLYISPETV
jgi:hypothetical protein